MTRRLVLKRIGPIREAALDFADLTVLVGPQASGKSIALQWLKLALDRGHIQKSLGAYGLEWGRDSGQFLDTYFGEGLRGLWGRGSIATWNGRPLSPDRLASRQGRDRKESLFLIPAQRVLTLRDGWPRPFSDYAPGDPYVVRSFSESLRLVMEQEFKAGESLFPRSNRLKAGYREMLSGSLFSRFSLRIEKDRAQKRLVLRESGAEESLPFMVWSAGQREFMPLLLGLYWLMPPVKAARRGDLEWVVIEEPEMGLHPRAISAVLMLVFELLWRGYRVCVSTHSPQLLEVLWALEVMREHPANPAGLLHILGAPNTQALRNVARTALEKKVKVYYFEQGRAVHDISHLDPDSASELEAGWGGLVDPSSRTNDTVATIVGNA